MTFDARFNMTSPVIPGGVASQANRACPDPASNETPPRDWLRNVCCIVLTNVALFWILVTFRRLVEFPRVDKRPGGDARTEDVEFGSSCIASKASAEVGRYKDVEMVLENLVEQEVARSERKNKGIQEPATATMTASEGDSQLRRATRTRLWKIVKA